MNQFKRFSFTVFLLVFAAMCSCGYSASGETTSGPAAVVQDDVVSKTHAFHPLLNVVDVRAGLAPDLSSASIFVTVQARQDLRHLA